MQHHLTCQTYGSSYSKDMTKNEYLNKIIIIIITYIIWKVHENLNDSVS